MGKIRRYYTDDEKEGFAMKRKVYTDGWHERCGLSFYVENGRLIRGVMDGRTMYPYRITKDGMDNVSGIAAKYGLMNWVCWC